MRIIQHIKTLFILWVINNDSNVRYRKIKLSIKKINKPFCQLIVTMDGSEKISCTFLVKYKLSSITAILTSGLIDNCLDNNK